MASTLLFMNLSTCSATISPTVTEDPEPHPIISDELNENYLQYLSNSFIFTVAVLGVVTNIVNIRVFVYQGLASDSNTIGLFLLAIADLISCLSLIPQPICIVLRHVTRAPTYYGCLAWTSLLGSTTHMLTSRITCWITVYIAVERSLCVLMPFKVKRIFRPKFTATCMTMIYLVIIAAYIPFFMNTWVQPDYSERFNETVPVLMQGKTGKKIAYYISFTFNNILTTTAIGIVAIATGLMIYKLMASRKWRKSMSGGASDSKPTENNNNGRKDMEVLKTVTMVTGLFVICTSMSTIPGFAFAIIPDATPTGVNKNFYRMVYSYKVFFDLTNSSLNYFFYIHFSSRYKASFSEVFGKKKET